MRIKELHIHGFGALRDVELQFGGAPVTILYGENEAGKSTMFAFIRTMLYGFPSRQAEERFEPSDGGTHGGRMIAEDGRGRLWTIERNGAGSSRISLITPGGEMRTCTQAELERELLGGLSADLFRQLFAVSLSELQQIRTLQSEEVSGFLFHAGLGGGGGIVQAERKLSQEMDKLFRPRGRTQEINRAMQSIEALDKEIRQRKALIQQFNDQSALVERVEGELAEAEQALTALRAREAEFAQAQGYRDSWLEKRAIERELAALPAFPSFPEDALSRWQTLQQEQEHLEVRGKQLDLSIAKIDEELASCSYDEKLLEQREEIDGRFGQLDAVEARRSEMRELEAELSAERNQLERLLRLIDPRWTADELRRFSLGAGSRERVREEQERNRAYARRSEWLQHECSRLRRQCDAAGEETDELRRRLEQAEEERKLRFGHIIPRTKEEGERIWAELVREAERWRERRLLRQTERRQAEAQRSAQDAAAEQMRKLRRATLIAAGALTAIVPFLLWRIGQIWEAAAILAGLLGLDAYLYLSGPRGKERPGKGMRRAGSFAGGEADENEPSSLSGMDDLRMLELFRSLVRSPAGYRGQPAIGETAVSAVREHPDVTDADFEERINALRPMMDEWFDWHRETEQLRARYRESAQAEESLRRALEALEREREEEARAAGKLAEAWDEWLRSQSLPEGLSPEAAHDIFRTAEQAMELLQRMEQRHAKKEAISERIAVFEEACMTLLAALERSDPEGDASGDPPPFADIAYELKRQKNRLERHEAARQRSARLNERRTELAEEREEIAARLGQAREKTERLFALAAAQDEEQFRRHVRQAERRVQLEQALRHLDIATAHSASIDRLAEVLERYDADRLGEAVRLVRLDISAAEARIGELQERRGRLLGELDQLREASEHEDHLQRKEGELAVLHEKIGRYATYAISLEWLKRTRRIYEEERQPFVLQTASAYFAAMTEGRYRRVFAPLGEKRMVAEREDGALADSSLLSRGTAEQLYFAMRLALSDAFAAHPHMPLILDDIFVNFDLNRLSHTFDVLSSMRDRHQIVMTTCHEHVVRTATERIRDANVIALSEGIGRFPLLGHDHDEPDEAEQSE
ncbi:AAA family ATPase [Paenibacillus sp. MSJ-34]|uniref:AAA family ATPase n=1 Tax=Paenibacillus sp. MSJ-34 TaxID=2841529 RepID=UPI001C1227E4|nr:AAA family ATPase [Paenibacillus sp. MSJ-34]MBU5442119.1 AAA family ATPase [Paenibacillus sp. MSJ-34]